MKKNIVPALVIFFITIAFLFVIYDLSRMDNTSHSSKIDKTRNSSELVGFDKT